MGQEKKEVTEGQLPKIVIELATMVSHRDQQGNPAGPMTFIAALGRKAKTVLELADLDGDGQLPKKFLGVQVLAEFAQRVITDYEETWKLLDAIDEGALVAVPQKVLDDNPEPGKKAENDDHADSDGTDPTDTPSRSGNTEASE